MILFTWFLPGLPLVLNRIRKRNGASMFDDPKALTSANWNDIHVWLIWFWTYLPLVITFGLSMLTAYAVIPSLVATGQLPASANRLKMPLTGFAFLVFVAAVVVLVLGISSTLDLEKFWDRYLI